MLRGVPLPQCIAHACRDMQKHVWTCICLQLFLNCIEKLSTNTALCISQRQPHTQLAPTTCHSFCFCLAFLSSGSLALLCGRPTDRPNDMHAICLSAPGEFPHPDMPPHLHIPDIPAIRAICLLSLAFSSLPVVTFQGIHALFIFLLSHSSCGFPFSRHS